MGLLNNLKKLVKRSHHDAGSSQRAASEPTPPGAAAPEPEEIHVAEITTSGLAEALEGGAVRVIDVRQPWDYAAMHIPGAVSIPLNTLPMNLDKLSKDEELVLVCYHGFSSQDGAAFLMDRGYGHVRSMQGGFTQWAAEGRPTEQ